MKDIFTTFVPPMDLRLQAPPQFLQVLSPVPTTYPLNDDETISNSGHCHRGAHIGLRTAFHTRW